MNGKLYLGTVEISPYKEVEVVTPVDRDNVDMVSLDPDTTDTSITFEVKGQPKSFVLSAFPKTTTAINTNSNSYNYVLGVSWNGTGYNLSYGKYRNLYGDQSNVSHSYNSTNSTITITTTSNSYGRFKNGFLYVLLYNY